MSPELAFVAEKAGLILRWFNRTIPEDIIFCSPCGWFGWPAVSSFGHRTSTEGGLESMEKNDKRPGSHKRWKDLGLPSLERIRGNMRTVF